MKKGIELIEEINNCDLQKGNIAFWWLGQMGYIVKLGDLNIPEARFIGLSDDTSITSEGLKITGIAAAHEFLDKDVVTGSYPYLGFIIEGNGCVLYHSGDTCIYEGLYSKLW